jgi:hypothetical protein
MEIVMTFQEYLSRALSRRLLSPTERLGQAYMNVLETVRPDLGNQIRGSVRDPFYNDDFFPAFMVWVEDNW